MTPENLLSGLIGGLVVGVLGVAGVFLLVRDNRRWQAENLAGARLVYHEVRLILVALKSSDFGNSVLGALSKGVWEAEQVRVATILKPNDLEQIVLAYLSFTALVAIANEMASRANPVPIREWLKTDGAEMLETAVEAFTKAEAILERRTAP